MKHWYPDRGTRGALRAAGAMLTVFALLQGCAAPPAKNAETIPAVTHAQALTPEQKADFAEAMKLADDKQYEKAADLLSKIVNAGPANAISAIDLALVYEKLGKMKEAEESLQAALKADPDNPVAANEYALLYRKTGRFAEARALYEQTLEKYPHFIMMHKNLGVLCDLYLKDYACAIQHYTSYSEVKQDDKMVKMWIADLKQRSGK